MNKDQKPKYSWDKVAIHCSNVTEQLAAVFLLSEIYDAKVNDGVKDTLMGLAKCFNPTDYPFVSLFIGKDEEREVSLFSSVSAAGKMTVDFQNFNQLFVPNEIRVPLNTEYTAVVTKDTVKVGCQTFPSSKIHDLFEALKQVSSS